MSRINTNISSMIAARVLNTQRKAMNVSLERLSTGLRINSGRDDPAGLIASEILRGEKTALSAAIANGERASHVIATTEAALSEVSALLTELEDLVSSAANEAGQSADEIQAMQLQVDSILSTINRIANSTEFGGAKLLDGSLGYSTSGANLSAFNEVNIRAAKMADGASKTVVVAIGAAAETAQVGGASAAAADVTLQVTGNRGVEQFSFASGATAANIAAAINGSKDFTGVSAMVSGGLVYFNSIGYGSDQLVKVEAISGSYGGTGEDTGADVTATINGQTASGKGLKASVNNASLSVEVDLKSAATGTKTFTITGGGATFSLAADVLTGIASIGIQATTTANLGDATNGYISSIASGQANELSSTNLGTAQRIVKSAIKEVASLRGRLGAFQKFTIDSTVNALNVALENTAAAESAIRDTDFAAETANFARSQILVQAATMVLQQANIAPQNVLSLLQ